MRFNRRERWCVNLRSQKVIKQERSRQRSYICSSLKWAKVTNVCYYFTKELQLSKSKSTPRSTIPLPVMLCILSKTIWNNEKGSCKGRQGMYELYTFLSVSCKCQEFMVWKQCKLLPTHTSTFGIFISLPNYAWWPLYLIPSWVILLIMSTYVCNSFRNPR